MKWLATLREGVLIAFDSLRSNRVRSGLTLLGVAIGVAVVMVMAGVIQGVNDSFQEVIASRGVTTFYVAHASPTTGLTTGLEDEPSEFLRNPILDPGWARELQALPEIRRASAYADLTQSPYEARAGSERVRITLSAVDADFLEIDAGDVVDGRFFTATEDRRGRPLALVDSATAADLYGRRDPIDRDVSIGRGERSSRFRIVGIYDPPANLFAGLASHYVLIPFSAARKYLSFSDRYIAFVVRPRDGVSLAEAVDAVRGRMRQLRGLGPGVEDDFSVITQDEILDLWGQLTTVLFAVLVALSGVGLLVGGIGVIGIMMISVTERTREIGIRKAMGARRRDILWQFLVEAATLTALGGAIGMAFGGATVWAVNAFSPIPATVPAWALIAALAVSALTGIGFGLYPASRGARLAPVDALRYE